MGGVYERKDRYYQLAKSEGYRSRAAYKLIELDKKFKFLKPKMKVLDLGSFPGGWLQVAGEKVGAAGMVLGVDLQPIDSNWPVGRMKSKPVIFQGDVSDIKMQQKLLTQAGGKVDLVLSDMSPQLSGIRFRDAARSAELVEVALRLCLNILKHGGTFVAKIFPGPESDEVARSARELFGSFTRECLGSSRKSSNEYYFVGRTFKFKGADVSEISSANVIDSEDQDNRRKYLSTNSCL